MNENDFVKGKWYKSYQFSNVVAVKFKEFRNKGIESCETIFLSSKKIEKTKAIWNKETYPLYSFKEVSLKELKEYIPIGHEDYERIEFSRNEFPSEGCANYTPELQKYISEELNCRLITEYTSKRKINFISWADDDSGKAYSLTEYKSEMLTYYNEKEISELIKTNKNENKSSTTKVCGTSSEIERSIGKGTIAVECRRQQASIRGRLNGDIARSVKTTTSSIKAEICPKIGQRSNS